MTTEPAQQEKPRKSMQRNCDHCKKPYTADQRNVKRGWGLCCSKSCAAKKRERSKPRYNELTVALNNYKRERWMRALVGNDEFECVPDRDIDDLF